MSASKVLHVRNLPDYCSESELISLLTPFGTVAKVMLLQDKRQAFVQMATIQAATSVLSGLEYNPPSIRGKPVYFQFSNRQEVESKGNDGATNVLLITVANVSVPVSLENIHTICSPYGEVQKIITFPKGNDVQALVQMSTLEAAMSAKNFLNGKDMFQGCCHLRVVFSKRTQLVIKQNDNKSRDFTSGGGQGLMNMGMSGIGGGMGGMSGGLGGGLGGMGGGVYGNQGGNYGSSGNNRTSFSGEVLLVNNLADEVTCDVLFTLFGVYGDVVRVKFLFKKKGTALVQMRTSQQAYSVIENLNQVNIMGQAIALQKSRMNNISMPNQEQQDPNNLTQDYSASPHHRFKNKKFVNKKNINAPSQILHIANLYEEATEQELRNLFAAQQPLADTPVIVEFFKSTRRMCYVQLASVHDAVHALINLHNQTVGNYPIRVSFSHKEPGSITDSDGNENQEIESKPE